MSKKSNQAIKEIKAASSIIKKTTLAEFGLMDTTDEKTGIMDPSKPFSKAYTLVHFIKHAAWLESLPLPPPQHVFEATKLHRDVAWNSLVKETLAAFKSGNGNFFREMANAIELTIQPNDPRRAFVFTQIGSRKAFKKRLPTKVKLKEQLDKLGLPTDRQSVKRMEIESGQNLPKGKRGPKRNRK